MNKVAKYNTFKVISTILTGGTPVATLLICGGGLTSMQQSVSFVGTVALFLTFFIFKDKIMEEFKSPTALKLALIGFICVTLFKDIITTMQYVFLATIVASTIDELTFKHFYKVIEAKLPEGAEAYKFLGFLWTTTQKMEAELKEDE